MEGFQASVMLVGDEVLAVGVDGVDGGCESLLPDRLCTASLLPPGSTE